MATATTTRMGPINATVRFLCEIAALYGIAAGMWLWTGSITLTVIVTVAAMVVWAVFRVPDDPGTAPVAVTGFVRLTIETTVFAGGIAGMWAAHGAAAGIVFLVVVAIHYLSTPARLRYVLSSHR